MKCPSADDIEQMKARGHEAASIPNAIQMTDLGDEAIELCQVMEEAFRGVQLGNGIGLFEAQGLDDYADAATCAAYREKDEKEDWGRIDPKDLNRCHSSLCFFNAEGMRFHLPAFLTADLRGELGIGMDFCLAHQALADHPKFSLLSPEQRLSVRMYLLHIIHVPDYELSLPDIRHALDHYWVWPLELEPRKDPAEL